MNPFEDVFLDIFKHGHLYLYLSDIDLLLHYSTAIKIRAVDNITFHYQLNEFY